MATMYSCRWLFGVLLGLTLTSCAPGGNGSTTGRITVTNAKADGPGSFAAAIQAANSDSSIQEIEFSHRGDSIVLREPLTFSGTQDLSIHANGVILNARALTRGSSAFTAVGGG